MAATEQDIISWEELGPPLGVAGHAPQFILYQLSLVIEASVRAAFPETIPVAVVAEALGIAEPEKARWNETVSLYIRDLARQAAQARIGQAPTSPIGSLSVLSAGELIGRSPHWKVTCKS